MGHTGGCSQAIYRQAKLQAGQFTGRPSCSILISSPALKKHPRHLLGNCLLSVGKTQLLSQKSTRPMLWE